MIPLVDQYTLVHKFNTQANIIATQLVGVPWGLSHLIRVSHKHHTI